VIDCPDQWPHRRPFARIPASRGEDILGVNTDRPVAKPLDVIVTPPLPGEYVFTCQMQMYRETLVVR